MGRSKAWKNEDLKRFRELIGMTQKEFAEHFKLNLETLRSYEQNRRRVSNELIKKLTKQHDEMVSRTFRTSMIIKYKEQERMLEFYKYLLEEERKKYKALKRELEELKRGE